MSVERVSPRLSPMVVAAPMIVVRDDSSGYVLCFEPLVSGSVYVEMEHPDDSYKGRSRDRFVVNSDDWAMIVGYIEHAFNTMKRIMDK